MRAKPALRLAAAAAAVALAGCASTPRPVEQMAAARTMMSQAQPAARNAPMEFHTAQSKLARAEDALQRGDYVNARILAEQAEVDAKYAWTVAENARMQRAAAELDQGIRTLREELDRRVQ